MSSFTGELREARLNGTYSQEQMVSRRTYNAVLGGTLLWGFIINVILCATIGNVFYYVNPIGFLIGYLVSCLFGILLASKSDNPVISFLGYNMIVIPIGIVISSAVDAYGGMGSEIVVEAFLITMCVTASMTAFAIIKPEWCSKIGLILFPSLIGLLIAELIMLILGMDNIAFAWGGAILFSLYIAYDVYRSQQFAPTIDNAVDSAIDIYLDIANLFVRILKILGKAKR